ncbi:hypothetical protein F4779DRAFT_574516 [Xylariaceae sp. FL0662B]|nr:hypothetical protein F4779DRAFT_574516 [Xylariaceae sp. FL0662B]
MYRNISSCNALASAVESFTQLPRPQFKYLRHTKTPSSYLQSYLQSYLRSVSTRRASTNDNPDSRSRQENHKLPIMSSGEFRYQGFSYGPFNPTAPVFIPFQHHGHQTTIRGVGTDTGVLLHQASQASTSAAQNTSSQPVSLHPLWYILYSLTSYSNGVVANKRFRPRSPKQPPSAASGGIPEPTPEYLMLASLPPFILPYTRRILVVIDLNGTLLFRPSRTNPTSFIERPHARVFLSYCIEVFNVVIWSSAKPNNVYSMCKQLMTEEQLSRVVAIWGRDRFNLSRSDYTKRVDCYKRLTTLWADPAIAASHPDAENGARWSQKDTVLVDDSVEKARSEPYNLVEIPEFKGNPREDDRVLPQVHDYLNECSRQADISTYMRVSPFRAVPLQKPVPIQQ